MSMHPQAIAPIPEETARVAHAALPRSNTYLTTRDQLGIFYNDQVFAPLFSERGRPAEAPWQVALVCVFQFLEGLSDRQAAEAVRTRIDWKYALGLELADPGFDFSVLSKFRSRLLAGSADLKVLYSSYLLLSLSSLLLKTVHAALFFHLIVEAPAVVFGVVSEHCEQISFLHEKVNFLSCDHHSR